MLETQLGDQGRTWEDYESHLKNIEADMHQAYWYISEAQASQKL